MSIREGYAGGATVITGGEINNSGVRGRRTDHFDAKIHIVDAVWVLIYKHPGLARNHNLRELSVNPVSEARHTRGWQEFSVAENVTHRDAAHPAHVPIWAVHG